MRQVRAVVRIRGQVQGVGYRYFSCQVAQKHDLSGWVKNLPNGDVAALLEGKESDIRAAIEALQQGPSMAQVDEVLIDWQAYRGEFSCFEICR